MINLHDSLYHNVVEDEIEEQVKDLVAEDNFRGSTVFPFNNSQMAMTVEYFSAAFATCLVHYQPQEATQFDCDKMREHLLECLALDEMKPFPTV